MEVAKTLFEKLISPKTLSTTDVSTSTSVNTGTSMTNISNSNNNTHTDWRYVVGGLLLGGVVLYWMQDRRLITQEQRFAAERTAAADRAERAAAAERAERIAAMEAERAERIATATAERAERKELYDRLQAALGGNGNAAVLETAE